MTDLNAAAAERAVQVLEHVGLVPESTASDVHSGVHSDVHSDVQSSVYSGVHGGVRSTSVHINPLGQPVLLHPRDNRLPTASNGFGIDDVMLCYYGNVQDDDTR